MRAIITENFTEEGERFFNIMIYGPGINSLDMKCSGITIDNGIESFELVKVRSLDREIPPILRQL